MLIRKRSVAWALLGLAAVFLYAAPAARAQTPVIPDERIQSFGARITVQQDGSLDVIETIAYDFGVEDRHGIYRDIPLDYDAGRGDINISDVLVTDPQGQSYTFKAFASNGFMRIKIGDPDVLVTGVKTYVIDYHVDGAVQWGQDEDLVLWNVTGDGWEVPIEQASVILTLPLTSGAATTTLSCYQGPYYSTEPCHVNGVTLASTRPLEPHEGITFSLSFSKGALVPPPPSARLLGYVLEFWPLLVPVGAFVLLFRRWWRHGRDPKGRGTIIPEYEPPQGLSPVETGALLSGRIKSVYVSAQIISLAVRGFLKITPTEGNFLKSKDYTLEKIKDAGAEESAADQELMKGLFGNGHAVTLSKLKRTFASTAESVKGAVYANLIAKGLYDKDPRKVIAGYLIAGFVLIFGSFWILSAWSVALVAALLTGVLIIVFGFIMPRVTREGALAKEAIKGFRDYLDIAEKDRLNFHNAPEKTPELFERFLPYALALGVVDAWAKEFEGIYVKEPQWYGGTWHGSFAATALAHDLGGFSAASTQAFAAGSSGSGGGGFSGGGAGGGGGGSW